MTDEFASIRKEMTLHGSLPSYPFVVASRARNSDEWKVWSSHKTAPERDDVLEQSRHVHGDTHDHQPVDIT